MNSRAFSLAKGAGGGGWSRGGGGGCLGGSQVGALS